MRKWLAGWLSALGFMRIANRVWPNYSERMRIEQGPNRAEGLTWTDVASAISSARLMFGDLATVQDPSLPGEWDWTPEARAYISSRIELARQQAREYARETDTPWHDGICVRP